MKEKPRKLQKTKYKKVGFTYYFYSTTLDKKLIKELGWEKEDKILQSIEDGKLVLKKVQQ